MMIKLAYGENFSNHKLRITRIVKILANIGMELKQS